MKIIYLVWGEALTSTGIYGSQVLGQLQAIRDRMPNSSFMLLYGAAWLSKNVILGAGKIDLANGFEQIRQRLKKIDFTTFLLCTPNRFFIYQKNRFGFLNFLDCVDYKRLAQIFREFSPQVVHCRSYPATYAALKVRSYTNAKYKVIFDARGLAPEELVLTGLVTLDDQYYRRMKEIERYLLSESDVTVAVSDPMQKHYESIGVRNCKTIYLSAPVDILQPSIPRLSEKRDRTKTILCYVGSLAKNTWHKPEMLFAVYRHYRKCVENPSLLIVTQSNKEEILEESGDIPLSEIELISTHNSQELAACLHRSSFGILPYFIPSTPCEHLVANTVIACKTAEYLAAGLPMLVNKYCGGAREIINKNGLGLAYNPENMQEITSDNLTKLLAPEMSISAVKFAKQNFDYQANGQKYADLYFSLFI
jgi:glycosyltransferase involved in cell wall biosynthesis